MLSYNKIYFLIILITITLVSGLPPSRTTKPIVRPKLPRLPRIPLPINTRFLYSGTPESPKLSYHLGNEQFRKIQLQHYDPLNLKMNRRASQTKMLCHYIGKDDFDSSATFGITGCPGESNVQVTLVSRKLTAQYLLHNTSDIALPIPSPWLHDNSSRNIDLSKTQLENDAIYINQFEQSAFVAAVQCSEGKSCQIPILHKMTIKIGYDSSLASKEPDTLAWISSVMTHTQTFFYHPSLPTKIQIEVVESPKFYANSKWRAEDSITKVEQYARGDFETNLYVFLCADANLYGTVGIAYVGGLCDTNGYQVSINEWRETEAATAKVVAHEIGHNMGMSHDFDPNHSGQDCTGIMDYGQTPDSWSDCSQNDFRNHYFSITNAGKEHCLEVLSDDTSTPMPSSCEIPAFNGDGYCDDENNNEDCGFDGGDCCNNQVGDWNIFCTICECLHPEGGCENSAFVGDGYCDDENNNSGCGFDGGDCCAQSHKNWDHFCTECLCKNNP